ncbi:MAG: DUF3108 domain-containing protein [Bacteroidota bacterium]
MNRIICIMLGSLLPILTVGQLRHVPNQTFQKGEYLKFRIHYGLITAGYATLEVESEAAIINNRRCHHIIMRGFTHPGFDWVYKVRDVYETYCDEQSLLSLRFNRHIREGKFESYTETHFDHETHLAHYIDNKKRRRQYKVPENIQDVISAFYFARTYYHQDSLQKGDRISLRNFIDRKTVGLEAEFLQREPIKVKGTNFHALKFSLLIEESGLVTDDSKIVFWISDDNNKVPLRIESDLMIGALKADLIEWEELLHPLNIVE